MYNKYKHCRTIIGVDENGNIKLEYKNIKDLINDGYSKKVYAYAKHNKLNNKLCSHKSLYWFYKYPHFSKIEFFNKLLETKKTIIAYPKNNFDYNKIIAAYGEKGLKEYNFNYKIVCKCLNNERKEYKNFNFIKFKDLDENIKINIIKKYLLD